MPIIVFCSNEAVKFGVDGASFMAIMKYILDMNNVNNFGKLKKWVCISGSIIKNSIKFWNEKEIKRVMNRLIKEKVLEKRKNEGCVEVAITEYYWNRKWND